MNRISLTLIKTLHLSAVLFLFSFSLSFANLQFEKGSECDSINNELSSKFRFLGEWDFNGTPDYLNPESGEVSQSLIDYVHKALPESVNISASSDDYLGDDVQLNVELKKASEVYLTMVDEGAGWKNTLGYYTYDVSNPPSTVYDIDSLVIIFPNVTQPNALQPGDKVLLGSFPANTGIGYFLIAQGWVGDTICLKSHMVFSDSHLNTFTTEEYRQQTILLNYEQENQLLLGFEDIMRPGGDNDFNDAVFYVTAEPGAIDVTNLPKIPTALISGDTTLCNENAPALIKVELTGQAPWSIVYNNGIEEIEVKNIKENIFRFETLIKGTISLVSVRDNYKCGIATGEAVIKLSQPKATLMSNHIICESAEEEAGGFIISFDGLPPFSLTYKIDDQQKTVDNISENQFELIAPAGSDIKLISMRDNYCEGIIDGPANLQIIENPTITIGDIGVGCGENAVAMIDLNLGGQGPWTVNYLLADKEYIMQSETSEVQLAASEAGTLTFNSIENAYCLSTLSQSLNIQNKDLPTAVIDGFENSCAGGKSTVNISFSGEGPWNAHYIINGESKTSVSNENFLSIIIDQSGIFELAGVEDAYCENIAEGSVELATLDTPTGLIGNDVSLCKDDEATVKINLTGTAPFTLVYSDGEKETAVTTEKSLYEFTTTEFKTYTLVSVSDAHCRGEGDGSATISDASENIQVEIDGDHKVCHGEEIELALFGDQDELTIEWTTNGKGELRNLDQSLTSYTPAENEAGIIVFYVQLTDHCAIKTISKEVAIMDEIDAGFSISPEIDLFTNTQITFVPANNRYDKYEWDFGDGNSSFAFISSNEYIEGGVYAVELLVNSDGCEATESIELEILSKDELFVPNAFNPTAQNPENQVVKVYGNNIDESGFSFKIVNRWGKVMYQTNSFAEANDVGWDGVNNNISEKQELNVFTYILKGRFNEGDPFERTGTVTQVK